MTTWLLGSALMFSIPLATTSAEAASTKSPKLRHATQASVNTHHRVASHAKVARKAHVAFRGISCVPYARQVSGIEVGGNAWQWWDNAAGRYARGEHPEAGSVLAFRSNAHMRLGHVAVVAKVVNAREIMIDHANWPTSGGRGGVAQNVAVVDVSEANDWSAVRVELGRSGSFGSVYPTYGFIYDRPDHGVMEASVRTPAPQPELNPAPRDLRPVAERPWQVYEEVAEAPEPAHRRVVHAAHHPHTAARHVAAAPHHAPARRTVASR